MIVKLTGFARGVLVDGRGLRTKVVEYEPERGGVYVPSGRVIAADVAPSVLECMTDVDCVMSLYTIEDGVITAVERAGAG